MKLFAFAGSVALVLAGLTVPSAAQSQGQTLKGHLMDIACSSHHATEPGYTEKHDKKCLLMEGCVKSGYSLVTPDKKVLKFDAKGNELAGDLIKKTDRDKDWTVAVNGTVSGNTIAVTSLQLQ
jgi:hypothetical protein